MASALDKLRQRRAVARSPDPASLTDTSSGERENNG